MPPTAELLKKCGVAATATVEANLSSVSSMLQVCRGELAVHLAEGGMEGNVIVKSGTSLFLDGQGRTIKLERYRFIVQEGARLCLFNIALTDGLEGAITVGSDKSLVRNATLMVGWALFKTMQVLSP